MKGRSKTAPLQTELRNVRIIPNGKRICQPPPHPPQKRSGAVKRRETAPLRRLPRACPYYTTTGTDLSTPHTRLFPRGSLKVRSERRGAVNY